MTLFYWATKIVHLPLSFSLTKSWQRWKRNDYPFVSYIQIWQFIAACYYPHCQPPSSPLAATTPVIVHKSLLPLSSTTNITWSLHLWASRVLSEVKDHISLLPKSRECGLRFSISISQPLWLASSPWWLHGLHMPSSSGSLLNSPTNSHNQIHHRNDTKSINGI